MAKKYTLEQLKQMQKNIETESARRKNLKKELSNEKEQLKTELQERIRNGEDADAIVNKIQAVDIKLDGCEKVLATAINPEWSQDDLKESFQVAADKYNKTLTIDKKELAKAVDSFIKVYLKAVADYNECMKVKQEFREFILPEQYSNRFNFGVLGTVSIEAIPNYAKALLNLIPNEEDNPYSDINGITNMLGFGSYTAVVDDLCKKYL